MRTLGIIGGIAPPSTIDYYRLLTSRYRARSPNGGYPSIVIDSIDAQRFLPLVTGTDRPALIEFLLGELERLARAGVHLAIFASNTPHVAFDEVAARSPVPLLSIVEEAARVAQTRGFRTLGLLGAGMTMDAGFYPEVFARGGMSVVVPDEADRRYVDERYFAELVEGLFREETRAQIAAVVGRMIERDGIEAVILGGTELALLFRDSDLPAVPTLDTTSIHVDGVIERLLA